MSFRAASRRGVTLVELIVVIAIIGIIVSITMPAIYMARASSRRMKCQSNLQQLGTAILGRAERQKGRFTSGAFDWARDGSVVDFGWVADLVNEEIEVGKLLCPSNPAQISETYIDLLNLDPANSGSCANLSGSPPETLPDGSTLMNPCWEIVANPGGNLGPGTEARRQLVENRIYNKFYNTNYCASWFLVRSENLLAGNGNLIARNPACARSSRSLNSTRGPMRERDLNAATAPTSIIPILADASQSTRGELTHTVGEVGAGEVVASSFSAGPRRVDTLRTPTFGANTPKNGAGGWWAVWNRQVKQDYRGFGAVHQACNVFFADGHVGSLDDPNGDGLINNGFAPVQGSGFESDEVEVEETDLFSRYFLRAEPLK